MKTKICGKCKIRKSIKEFYLYKNNILQGYCKKCMKQYRDNHKKEIIGYDKKYRASHKLEISKYWRNWYIKNKEKLKEKGKTIEMIYKTIKQSSIHRNTICNISKEDFIKWYNNQEQKCYYCNRTLEEVKNDIKEKDKNKTRLSIDRKNNKKGYILFNMVLACRRCNIIKSDYFTEKEMLRIGKLLYNTEKFNAGIIK